MKILVSTHIQMQLYFLLLPLFFFAVVLSSSSSTKAAIAGSYWGAITTHNLRVTSVTQIYMQGSGENNTEKNRAQVAKSTAYL